MIGFVVGTALRDLRRSGVVGIAGILLSALTTVAVGGTVAGLAALGRLAAAWHDELRIVAILGRAPGSEAARDALVEAVQALPAAGVVRYVSTDEALAELGRYLGASGAGLDRLSSNPLSARVEVIPVVPRGPLGPIRAAPVQALVDALARIPGVQEVEAPIAWVAEAERVDRALRLGGFGLASLLAGAAGLVIAGGTVLARLRRADEIAVLRLAGVPQTRIWTPLVLQAAVQGTAGTALGLSVLLLASETGPAGIAAWVQTQLGLGPLPGPDLGLGLILIGVGVAAGLLGGVGATVAGASRDRRRRVLACVLGFVLGATGAASAAPRHKAPAGDALTAKKQALTDVQRQLDDARARATAARAREASVLAELEELDQTLGLKRRQVLRLDRRMGRLRTELSRLEGRRGRVAEDTVALQGALAARIQILDRLRQTPERSAWLGERAAMTRARLADDLGRVTRLELWRLLEFEETAEHLSTRQAAVARGRREVELLRQAVETERAAIEEQAERRRALLGRIRDDRSTYEGLVGELQEASRRLEALVQALARRAQARALAARVTARVPPPTLSKPDSAPPSQAPAIGLGTLRGQLPWPVEGRIVAGFGRQVHPRFGTETFRSGVAIAAAEGAVIRAVHEGAVAYRGWLTGYGNLMILDHGDGYYTLYGHASDFLVEAGDSVKGGQGIARVGDTGSLEGFRLYFEVRFQGRAEDPQLWLRRRS